MPTTASAEHSGEFVQSLDRGLAVIRAFGPERPRLSLSDVARETGLSRASARRFLHTLVELGYVGNESGTFHLKPRLLELGYAYLSTLGLPEVARPHLRALSDRTGESSSLAVLDDLEIVYVDRVAVSRIMSAAIGVGTRLPTFATSMGRVLIAFAPDEVRERFLERSELPALTPYTITDRETLRAELERVRGQGWALVDQELEEGLRSIAAPVRDAAGSVVAAANIAAPARRDLDSARSEFLDPLLAAAAGIERDLARTGLKR